MFWIVKVGVFHRVCAAGGEEGVVSLESGCKYVGCRMLSCVGGFRQGMIKCVAAEFMAGHRVQRVQNM